MNQNNHQPPYQTFPTNIVRAAAAGLVAEAASEQHQRRQHLESEFFGQQGGVQGMGPAPLLVHEAGGGAIAERLLHPAFQILEREFRVLPEQGWFNPALNPKRPVEFQMGAYKVPSGMTLWLTDYQFQVLRPSGVDAGDFIVAEPGRFSNQMGFDINISGSRPGDISYQLDPEPVSVSRPEFNPPITARQPPSAFVNAQARTFASTASPATSLLPRRPNVQGPRGGPFTFVVDEQGIVNLNVVIFNALTSPIAAISGRLAGWLLHVNVSRALINRVRPR